MSKPSFPVTLFPRALLGTAMPRKAPPKVVRGVDTGVGLDSSRVRERLIEKLAKEINSTAVLEAMRRVERHRFVDSALVTQAYEDTALPIGFGQTISKPNVVARMIELLLNGQPRFSGKVLEIGSGCGYQAAVLGQLARHVFSMERIEGLVLKARANLKACELTNVQVKFGDGMLGFPDVAPYVAIIAAAGGEAIPHAWLDQLAMGGRLVAPSWADNKQQALIVIDKTPHGLMRQVLEPVQFVPLKSGILA
ncbi:MAG: protein-L-isoaspartate(D-aspartate) O-methyltransferase [Cytophagales bacterium]|nr:protein-L-isoaspartate(D-aspartate) O-methyltransferase [Cytophagales bacterium]